MLGQGEEWDYCMVVERWSNHPRWVSEFMKVCLLAGVGKGSKVLDVGCNTGNSFNVITTLGAVPFGTEPNSSARTRAEVFHGRTLQSSTADFPTSWFGKKDGGFDVVIANHVIGHVDEPRNLLNEMRRVVRKPGGVLVLVIPNPVYDRKMRLLNWLTGYRGDKTLKHLLPAQDITSWGRTAFLNAKIEQHYFGDAPKWVPKAWCPTAWRSRIVVIIRIEAF